jgi:hypothetical protein
MSISHINNSSLFSSKDKQFKLFFLEFYLGLNTNLLISGLKGGLTSSAGGIPPVDNECPKVTRTHYA